MNGPSQDTLDRVAFALFILATGELVIGSYLLFGIGGGLICSGLLTFVVGCLIVRGKCE